MPIPYEWDFIKGWMKLFLAESTSHKERKDSLYKSSFFHFSKAKSGDYREFKFLWAFFVIEVASLIDSKTLKEAKDTVRELAQSGYSYAQYLQGFLELKDNNINSALYWFKKSHESHFLQNNCSLLIGLLYFYSGDSSQAIPYLNGAIYNSHYESLKPELMTAYINQNETDSAFKVAKEIAENYTQFPLDISLKSMEFVSLTMFEGSETESNLKESYTWLERARLIIEANGNSIKFIPLHLPVLERQLPLSEQQEAKRRARLLYAPAREYSKMDSVSKCYRIFH